MIGGSARLACAVILGLALTAVGSSSIAADLRADPEWSALAADRVAARVGDSLTVLIYQDASASNSAQNGAKKETRIGGQIASGGGDVEQARLDFGGAYNGGGQTGRTDRMVAQITVVVTEVLPNSDLAVAGEQALELNGERTHIKLRGRVRRIDISAANTVLSTRLADAAISYNGAGFVSRSAKPGVVSRILGHLGFF